MRDEKEKIQLVGHNFVRIGVFTNAGLESGLQKIIDKEEKAGSELENIAITGNQVNSASYVCVLTFFKPFNYDMEDP